MSCSRPHQSRLPLLAEPVRLAFDVDRGGVMEEPIEDRAGDHRIAEHLAPRAKTLIAGQQNGAAFVATTDQLEERWVQPMNATRGSR